MPNMLISSEIGSEWQIFLGHPQAIECMDICGLSRAHGLELRGSDVIRKFFFELSRGTCPWTAFAWNFWGILLFFFLKGGGGLGGKLFIGNI